MTVDNPCHSKISINTHLPKLWLTPKLLVNAPRLQVDELLLLTGISTYRRQEQVPNGFSIEYLNFSKAHRILHKLICSVFMSLIPLLQERILIPPIYGYSSATQLARKRVRQHQRKMRLPRASKYATLWSRVGRIIILSSH